MPDGTLVTNIQTLQSALEAVTKLLGQPPQGNNIGSGLTGAAGLAATSPVAHVQAFQDQLTQQISTTLQFDSTTALSGVTNLFTTLQVDVQAPASPSLQNFSQSLAQVNTAFSSDFVQRLQQILDAIRGISQGVPQDHTAIVSTLLDQMIGLLTSLEGPEAQKISAWIESLKEMNTSLQPLIQQAQSSADPSSIVIQYFQNTLNSILDVFGFNQVNTLLNNVTNLLGSPFPQAMLSSVATSIASVSSAYGQMLTLAKTPGTSEQQFNDAATATTAALQNLKAQLPPLLSAMRSLSEADILQPHALANALQEQMEQASSVQVLDVQKIDDPFNALLDRIDTAISAIDLTAVRTNILGFFTNIQQAIQRANISSVGSALQQELTTLESSVQNLQQSVTNLLAQIKDFFANLTQKYQGLLPSLGDFQPDGTYQFHFERDLQHLLTSAQIAIGGDPNNPSAPSVAGSLKQFQQTINQFFQQIQGLLQPVSQEIGNDTTAAVNGINSFSTYLQGLNIPSLMDQLQQKVQQIVDALGSINFDVAIDPVVEKIGEATDKLHSVHADSLNPLLRGALQAALGVVISIDFTAKIRTPLEGQFTQVKAVPTSAIAKLQKQYDDAVSKLNSLNPDQLLIPLSTAFNKINTAVGSLDAKSLLQPLDQVHQQYLDQPLDQLKPSTLLKPVADSFQDINSQLNGLSGAAIIAPLNTSLNDLKTGIAGFNIGGSIDDLLAAVNTVKQDLGSVRPSELLQPLVAEFTTLDTALDRFKPSVVAQPVTQLAPQLLQFLDNIQQQTIDALYQLFQPPLQFLDRLQPDTLTQNLQQQIDGVLNVLSAVDLGNNFNSFKGQYFDLKQAVDALGNKALSTLVDGLDPASQLDDVVNRYNDSIAALNALKQNVQLTNLSQLYTQLRKQLLAIVPQYGQKLLDTETFKRFMHQADPTSALQALDQRFTTIKNKLLAISPQDIGAALDANYEAVLAQVNNLHIEDSLNQVKTTFNHITSIINSVRVDFLAADIDKSLNDFRAVVAALDPAKFIAGLDTIHQNVEKVVNDTRPSNVLTGLQGILDQVQSIVKSLNPETILKPPLDSAWQSVEGALAQVNFTTILQPILDKLDELEQAFEGGLQSVESAFDEMLGAAKDALSGSDSSSGLAAVGV